MIYSVLNYPNSFLILCFFSQLEIIIMTHLCLVENNMLIINILNIKLKIIDLIALFYKNLDNKYQVYMPLSISEFFKSNLFLEKYLLNSPRPYLDSTHLHV